ncbi:YadA-like family protein [Actinobacillus equuli subsp. haemolyticus]|uniref:YadA-like family protein n=1 Tax=Actinobacillus equuli TaxID=718 RepID=UPI0024466170|nr:YadA-like family protein [Actinobacillus equuli]WGE73419.1 YadA-like family protein [Actinobacillus equuli subsp. haemolyticus]
MNKIFKVIWNHATQSFVVVSELSRNKGKVSSVNSDGLVPAKSTLALSLAGTALLSSALVSMPNSVEAAVAIGSAGNNYITATGVTATGAGNVVAIGTGAQATGSNSMAIGSSSIASAVDSTALGANSRATGGGSVALGRHAKAGKVTNGVDSNSDVFTIAIGAYANATDNGAIAIGGFSNEGFAARAKGNNAIALGVNANATGAKSTSIGSDSQAIGERALSFGDHANTTARYAMAIGAYTNSTAENATALGTYSKASGVNATSIGSFSSASAERAIAVGTNVSSSGYNAIAIGGDNLYNRVKSDVAGSKIADYTITQNQLTQAPKTQASATGSTAIGVNSVASAILSTVVGPLSTATGRGATALGLGVNATNDAAVVLGVNSTASGLQAVAIGTASIASDESSVVVGSKSRSTGFQSVAVGVSANASGYTALAIGDLTNSTSNHSTAIGYTANARNHEATAIGTAALASGIASFAAGSDANATANFTIAMGQNSNAKQENTIAVGVRADANGVDALAMGTGSKAAGTASIALGKSAESKTQNGVAIGNGALTSENQTVAVGALSRALGTEASAFGFGANASASSAVALGVHSKALANSSVALGRLANASADAAVSIGIDSKSSGTGAVSLGNNAQTTKNNAIAIGTGTKATEQSALALGPYANATISHSVALGSSSTTTAGVNTNTATVNGLTYSGFAGNRVHSVVSVGSDTQKRQIQNVAAGQISENSTDAINGSQLYATQQVLGNVANSVKTVLGGNAVLATTGTISTNNIGNTGKDTVHDAIAAVKEHVVKGKNTDVTFVVAQNGSTTYTVDAWNTTVTNGSGEVSVISTTDNNNKVLSYTVDLSQAAKNNITTANTTAHNANATANTANTTANNALTEVKKGWNITTKANGGNAKDSSTEQVSMGELVTFEAGSNINLTQKGANITIATSDKPTFNTVTTQNFNVQNGGTVDMGGNVVSNVGTAQKGTDAVNYDLLNKTVKAASSSVVKGKNTAVSSTKDDNGTVYTVDAWNTTVQGAADIDVKSEIEAATNTLKYTIDLSQTTKQNITTANTTAHNANATANAANVTVNKGWNITTAKSGTGNVVNNTDENVKMGEQVIITAGDNVNISQNGKNITIATSNKPTFSNVTTKDLTVQAGGTVNMGGNAITNVANGTKPTDAVNLQQLNASKVAVLAGLNTGVTSKANATTGGTDYVVNSWNTTAQAAANGNVTVTSKVDSAKNTIDYTIDLTQTTKDTITNANVTAHNANTTANLANTTANTANATVNKGWNLTANKDTTAENIQMGDTVDFSQGDNIVVTRDGKGIKIATSLTPTFTDMTTTNLSVKNGGNVDMGGNKVQNVANGTKPTDAVNLQQLNASRTFVVEGKNANVTSAVGADGSTTYTVNAWNTTAKGSSDIKVTNVTDAAGRTIDYTIDLSDSAKNNITTANNTANAANATVNKGWNITTAKTGTGNAENISDTNVQMGGKVIITAGDNVNVSQNGSNITIATSKTPTFTSVTAGNTQITNEGLTIQNGPSITNNGVNAGNKAITNVANGTNANDAVNLQQLNASKVAVLAGLNTAVTAAANTTTGGTDYKVDAWNTTAQGATDISVVETVDANTKAIKYSIDLSQSAKSNITTANTTAHNANATANTANATVNKGWNLTANKADANKANIQMGETVDFSQGDNIVVTQDGKGIKIATSKNPTFTEVTVGGDTKLTNDGLTINNGPSITNKGIDAASKPITNVAKGTNGMDAVNLDQLNEVKAATTTTVTSKDNSISVTESLTNGRVYDLSIAKSDIVTNPNGTTANKNAGNTFVTGDNLVNVLNNTSFNVTSGSVDSGKVTGTKAEQVKAGETVIFKAGNNLVLAQDGQNFTYSLSNTLDLTDKGSIKLGNTTLADNNVSVGNVSVTDKGINAANTTISNVKDGKVEAGSKEAVNGGQLFNATTNLTNAGLNFVGNNVSGVIHKNLSDTLAIVGELDNTAAARAKNVRVDTENGKLVIKLSENPTFTTVTTGNTILDDKGLTIKNGPSITNNGIDAGNKQITNVAKAVNGTDAVNLDQLNTTVKAASSSVIAGSNANVTSKTDANGTVYTVNAFNTTASAGSDAVTVNGTFDPATNSTNYVVDLSDKTKNTLADTTATVNKGWNITTSKSAGDAKDISVSNVKMGDTVTIDAGKNINITQNGATISIATSDKPTFTTATVGNTSLNGDNIKLGNTTINGNGLTINNGPSITNEGIDAANKLITNVANGVNGTDAVNLNQLNETKAAITTTVTSDDKSVTVKEDLTNGRVYDISVAQADVVTTPNGTAANNKAGNTFVTGDNLVNVLNNTSFNVTSGSVDSGKVSGTTAEQVKAGETVTFKAGNNLVLAQAGQNFTYSLSNTLDLTDKGSIKLGNTTITDNNVTVGGVSVTDKGINAANNTISNVKDGEVSATSKDAVNGSQLHATNQNVTNVTNTVNKGWNITTSASNGSVDGTSLTNVMMGDTVTLDAGKNINITQTAGKISIATSDKPTFSNVTVGDTKINNDGVTINNGPSVTKNGIDAANTTISNVKDGKVEAGSKEAVNGGQLFNATTNLTNAGLNFVGNNVSGVIHKNLSDTLAIVGELAMDAAASAKNVRVDTENGKLVIKLSENPTFTTVTTGNTVLNDQGLTIKDGPSITNNGIDAGNKQITNVAEGKKGTDAVNLDQLNRTTAAAKTELANSNTTTVTREKGADGQDIYKVEVNKGDVTVNNDGTVSTPDSSDSFATVTDVVNALNNVSWTIQGNGADKDKVTAGNQVNFVNGAGTTAEVSSDGTKTNVTFNVNKSGLTVNNGKVTANQPGDTFATAEDVAKAITDSELTSTVVSGNNNLVVTNTTTGNNTEFKVTLSNNLDLTDKGSVKIGNTTLNNDGLTVGNTSVTADGVKVGNVTINNDGIDAGGNKITDVANGTNATDAVNVSQLDAKTAAAKTELANGNTTTVTPKTGDNGQTIYTVEVNKAPVTINSTTGVAETSAAGDKANNSFATVGDVVNALNNVSWTIQGNGADKDKVTAGNQVNFVNGNGTTAQVTANDAGTQTNVTFNVNTTTATITDGKAKVANGDAYLNATTVADLVNNTSWSIDAGTVAGSNGRSDYVANSNSSISAGEQVNYQAGQNIVIGGEGKNVVIATNPNASFDSVAVKNQVTVGDTTINNEGVSINRGPSMTKSGIDAAGTKIANLQDGLVSADSTEAVNGSQLYATNQNVTNLTNEVAKGWNIEALTVEGSTGSVTTTGKSNVAMGNTVAVRAGNNINLAKKGNEIAIATSDKPTFNTVSTNNVVLKDNSGKDVANINAVTGEDGVSEVSIAGNNVTQADGSVSNASRITNVAAGKKDNDAVNVAQLKGAVNNINNSINAVNSKVDKVDRNLRAGIAGAMAAGNLYHVTIPGKSMVAAGVGTYKGQSAVAVGYSRLSDNGKIGVKFSVNTNTRGDSGAAASVGYQW